MIFADLVNGDAVFLDANTFVYHFAPDPLLRTPCGQLLQRIEKQDISGYTSTAVLSEVGHRLMTIEARTRPRWSSGKIVNRLKKNPAASKAHEPVELFRMAIPLFPVRRSRIGTA